MNTDKPAVRKYGSMTRKELAVVYKCSTTTIRRKIKRAFGPKFNGKRIFSGSEVALIIEEALGGHWEGEMEV